MTETVSLAIGPKTKYILSTSGRLSSLERYKKLLQCILKVDIVYIPISSGDLNKPAIDPLRFTNALRGMPCIGGAISRDIKHSVLPFLDELDESAESVLAVNTVIVSDNGSLKGYNTDYIGFRSAIVGGIKEFSQDVKRAVCYGYGGVTSVVTSALLSLGIEVFLVGRNLDTAAARAKELNVGVWTPGLKADLFVNATPASEAPLHMAANFLEALSSCVIAFDHEMPGKYLREYCELHGIFHIDGLKMYHPQMESQWKLFLHGLVEPDSVPDLLKEASAHN